MQTSLVRSSVERPRLSARTPSSTLPPALATLAEFGVAFICFDASGRTTHISPAAKSALGADALFALRTAAEAVASARAARQSVVDAAAGVAPSTELVVPGPLAHARWHLQWHAGPSDALAVLVLHGTRPAQERTALLEERMTDRERQVARLIASGASTKEIAARLAISPHTARRHTERVFQKCGVRCRAALAAMMVMGPGAAA